LDHPGVAAELARAIDDDLRLAAELLVRALRVLVGALLEHRARLADVAELDLDLRVRGARESEARGERDRVTDGDAPRGRGDGAVHGGFLQWSTARRARRRAS
jgi:hypothetical protein